MINFIKKFFHMLIRFCCVSIMLFGCSAAAPFPDIPTLPEDMPPSQVLQKISLTANGYTYEVQLYDNETAAALLRMIPMTLNMRPMPHEKYYNLSKELPTDAQAVGTIQAGDLMLWGNDCLVLFYEDFTTTYRYTRIGKIVDTTALARAVGAGNVSIAFQRAKTMT